MSKKRYVITASTFDRKGNLLSTATNDYNKSSTFMAKFAKLAGEPYRIFWHAEALAVYRALKKKQKIDSLVITRYDSEGNPKNSKPCKVCSKIIEFFEIPNVYYSTEEGMKKLWAES